GHHRGFIEIVDAPYQTPFCVTPCPVILEVGIADGQDSWGTLEIRTNCFNRLSPAEERRAQECESACSHPIVLALEIRLDHAALSAQPIFKCYIFCSK